MGECVQGLEGGAERVGVTERSLEFSLKAVSGRLLKKNPKQRTAHFDEFMTSRPSCRTRVLLGVRAEGVQGRVEDRGRLGG